MSAAVSASAQGCSLNGGLSPPPLSGSSTMSKRPGGILPLGYGQHQHPQPGVLCGGGGGLASPVVGQGHSHLQHATSVSSRATELVE